MEKQILIVGGTDGIGKAVALQMATHQYSATIIGRNPQKGADVLASLNHMHPEGQHYFFSTDLSLMKNVVQVVKKMKQKKLNYHTILHTADILRVARTETTEGLETSIATNFYARVLMNDLIMQEQETPPQQIVHVAAAGFPPGKNFRSKFPVSKTASSFTGHGIGQVANDFYGFYCHETLRSPRVQINILNPGMVDTDIRRNGSFPKWFHWLSPLMNLLLAPLTASPEEYAKVVVSIILGNNSATQHSVLIDSKGKAKKPSHHLLDTEAQRYVVDTARKEIEHILSSQSAPAQITD